MNYYNNKTNTSSSIMNNDLIHSLSFTHKAYKTNYDLIVPNENIITEVDGTISKLRINEKLPPLFVGEYYLSIWDLKLGYLLNVDIDTLLKKYQQQDSYKEQYRLIKNKKLDICKYDKVVIIHNIIFKKEYRGQGILNELIESIYRDYNSSNTLILMYVKPIQDNPLDLELYTKIKEFESIDNGILKISGNEFYDIDELKEITDTELSELKLYQRFHDCGFDRIDDSSLFVLNTDFTLNKLIQKFD